MGPKSNGRLHRHVLHKTLSALAFVSAWYLATGHDSAPGVALFEGKEFNECPRCDTLFTKVRVSENGTRVQDIVLQERGEPKSGTTFMCEWASKTLMRTCKFFDAMFGDNTCSFNARHAKLTFKPSLGTESAKCQCDSVDLVRIQVTAKNKHRLPVKRADGACPLVHTSGLARDDIPCVYGNGSNVESFADLWSCILESDCYISDDRPQFVIMRDPRAGAVSSYFHMVAHPRQDPYQEMSVDEAAMLLLPAICQWVTIRHFLFEGVMSNQSTVFWYQDAINDPLLWHYRLTAAFGLQLPSTWVELITEENLHTPVYNKHPGGQVANSERTWQSEISPETVDEMNQVLKTWLPPVILARLGLMTKFSHG